MMNNLSKLQNNKRPTPDQVRLLEASFKANNKLHPHRKLQLCHQLDIPVRQIAVWYQNRRARLKNQSLELDYGALENRLEIVLYQNMQLEKQVEKLGLELQKSSVVLQQPHATCVSSTCNEEGGSSNMNDQIDCSWMNGGDSAYLQASRVQDLYSFLMSN